MHSDNSSEEQILQAIRAGENSAGARDIQAIYVVLSSLVTKVDYMRRDIAKAERLGEERIKKLEERIDDHDTKLDELHDQSTRIGVVWVISTAVAVLVGEFLVLWGVGLISTSN